MTIDSRLPAAPPRGTRPRNRRALIIAAAAELFHRTGYDGVAMSDVADAVNVRPSALYRHFTGKPELLTAVVLAELAPFQAIFAEGATLADVLPRLCATALEHRRLGRLWQREARALPAAQRTALRHDLRATADLLTAALQASRPELSHEDADALSWCAWSVLYGVSRYGVELPKGDYEAVLRDIVATVLAFTPARAQSAPVPQPRRFTPVARREKLLTAAIAMFAERGYAGVSMEDIGASAGIAGPSVYHHFAAKQDILVAAITRCDEWLRLDLHRALAAARDARDALRGLLRSYVAFTGVNNNLLDVLITDDRHLPEDQRARLNQAKSDYLGEWLSLGRAARADLPLGHTRIRTLAVLAIANDIARTPHLRARPSTPDTIAALGELILLR